MVIGRDVIRDVSFSGDYIHIHARTWSKGETWSERNLYVSAQFMVESDYRNGDT